MAAIRALLCSEEEPQELKRVAATAVAIASHKAHRKTHLTLPTVLASQQTAHQPTPHANKSKADEANAAAATSAPDSAAKGASSTLPSLKEAIAHAATFWTLSKADNDLIDPSTGRCSLSTRAWQFLFQDVHSVAIGPSFNDLYADIQATLAAATLVNRVVRLLVYKQEQSKK